MKIPKVIFLIELILWWKVTTGLVLRQYCRRIYGTGISTAYHRTGTALKSNKAGSCLSVLEQYWTSVPCQHWNLYWFSTGITPKSVVRRYLFSELGLIMPVSRQPSSRYQLSSTSIAPCLQLARYYAVCKYWRESDFSTWVLSHLW